MRFRCNESLEKIQPQVVEETVKRLTIASKSDLPKGRIIQSYNMRGILISPSDRDQAALSLSAALKGVLSLSGLTGASWSDMSCIYLKFSRRCLAMKGGLADS